MKTKRILSIPVLFALIATTGCSTIVNHGRPAGVDVTSDPPGAEIFLDGRPTGARTPARIELAGGSAEHAIRVEKPGYGTFERTVAKEIDPWVWGNAPFVVFPIVAAAGFGIDAWCGQWYRVAPPKVDARLSGAAPVAPAPGSPAPNAATVAAPPAPKAAAVAASPEPKAAAVAAPPEPKAAAVSTPPAPRPEPAAGSDEMDEILKQILDND